LFNIINAKVKQLKAASNDDANLTVFAPTNAAFETVLTVLGKSSISEIPESVLLDIVEYHIVPSVALSTDLEATSYETLNGESVMVSLDNDGVQVDGNNVVIADIEATNGVVHVIDGVLLPSLYASAVGTIVEVPLFSKDYTILTEALVTADLVNTLLDTNESYTVFAPNNAAFEAAGINSLEGLTSEDLTPILLYHVVDSEFPSTQLPARTVTTLGGDFFLSFVGDDVFINGNTQINAVDIQKSNGVIHAIDRTLVPPANTIVEIAQDREDLSTLVSVLTSPDQAAVLEALTGEGTFTLFAPNNDAFNNISSLIDGEDGDDLTAAQITEVLQYHVTQGRVYSTDLTNGMMPAMLNGETVTVNIGDSVTLTDQDGGAVNPEPTVIEVNINGTNGVIHIIDEVLIPDLNN
jgi:transforming growth factor-beta-induced protein